MWLPSDSIAIITANYKLIPNFNKNGGMIGIARSMPISGAVDHVNLSVMKPQKDGGFSEISWMRGLLIYVENRALAWVATI